MCADMVVGLSLTDDAVGFDAGAVRDLGIQIPNVYC